jgi:NAD(P)-dependent dehydrogenase (short-subunit alcohol dehydrogenase family)
LKSGQHERRFETQGAAGQSIDDYYAEVGKRIPVGRVGEAEEVGDLVCYLASNRAGFITGTSINIDGGACAVD